MQLGRNDFAFIKGASKPSAMALRLTDKLFSKATLTRSTVHGTKDFEPLDPITISAIKSECSIILLSSLPNMKTFSNIDFTSSRWAVKCPSGFFAAIYGS